ncbi:MAG: hypothetical protein JO370_05405 [Paucibacter sp.]|nr:hypothetical protein [Roseateles sp.]
MKQLIIASLALASLTATIARADDANTSPATAPTATPALTSNIGLVSDYRFRGISQTWMNPAIQGGLDYAAQGPLSGLYVGTWGSNVSGNSYNNGAGMEWDVYGGWRTTVADTVSLDFGALAYIYPGASLNSAPGVASNTKYNNVDVYGSFSVGGFTAKLSVAATNYFGLNSTTAGFAYYSPLSAAGSSKGSAYLDLTYSADLGQGYSASLHLGRLEMHHYGELSYTDAKLALSKDFSDGFSASVAVIGTDADKRFYQVTNSAGLAPKAVGKAGVVLGVSRSF